MKLAQAGFDGVGLDSRGEMVGNDWRIGSNAVLGIAMNKLEQSSWLGTLGDHSRAINVSCKSMPPVGAARGRRRHR
ncbi:MAG: hypothetical protein U1F19_00215 [Lysobacterales bacterium]